MGNKKGYNYYKNNEKLKQVKSFLKTSTLYYRIYNLLLIQNYSKTLKKNYVHIQN